MRGLSPSAHGRLIATQLHVRMRIATPPPPTSAPLRVALYSHDSVGLGHQRRNLAIAHALRTHLPALTGREVTGLLLTGVERVVGHLPADFDVVRLPGIAKDAHGYAPREMSVPMTDLIDVRRAILSGALGALAPDLVVVDRHAFGVDDELLEPLRRLRREQPGTRVVLGLREVLDEPEVAVREWRRVGSERVRELFDAIWVYGDERVTDLRATGAVPTELHDLVVHTGYLSADRATRSFLRELQRPYLLTTVGGGHDGEDLCRAAVQAPVPEGLGHVVVVGPQATPSRREELQALAGPRTEVLDEVPEGLLAIRSAEAVACMGGYNTVCEVMSTDRPAVVVPREEPRQEQLIRARSLEATGAVDVIRAAELTPERLGRWFADNLHRSVDRSHLRRDGLAAVAGHAADLLATTPREIRHAV